MYTRAMQCQLNTHSRVFVLVLNADISQFCQFINISQNYENSMVGFKLVLIAGGTDTREAEKTAAMRSSRAVSRISVAIE